MSATKLPTSSEWSNICFSVFDLPSRHSLKLEDRIAKISQLVPEQTFLKAVQWTQCNGKDHLLQEMDKGKTFWLRKPGSFYYNNETFLRAQVRPIHRNIYIYSATLKRTLW
jgi:hypothetical protein